MPSSASGTRNTALISVLFPAPVCPLMRMFAWPSCSIAFCCSALKNAAGSAATSSTFGPVAPLSPAPFFPGRRARSVTSCRPRVTASLTSLSACSATRRARASARGILSRRLSGPATAAPQLHGRPSLHTQDAPKRASTCQRLGHRLRRDRPALTRKSAPRHLPEQFRFDSPARSRRLTASRAVARRAMVSAREAPVLALVGEDWSRRRICTAWLVEGRPGRRNTRSRPLAR